MLIKTNEEVFLLSVLSIQGAHGKKDKSGTHGYVCNLDFHENGRYTKVYRADIDKDIKKPKNCRLVDLGGRDENKYLP